MEMTIAGRFKEIVAQYGNNVALAYLSNGVYKQISYGQLDACRRQIASFFAAKGGQRGNKLAIMLPNSPEWIISDLAAATLGLVVVPIHTTFTAEYIKRVIVHSEAKYLVIGKEYFDKYRELISNLSLAAIIVVGDAKVQGNDVYVWPALNVEQAVDDIDVKVKSADVHTIIYTSGTTGDPKAVMLSHQNIIVDVDSAKRSITIFPEDRFFSFLPLSHAFERTAGYYTPIFTGASIYFAQSTKTIIEDIKLAKPTILSTVPRIFDRIYVKVFEKVQAGGKWKMSLFFHALQLSVQKRKHALGFFGKIAWKILDLVVLKKIRGIMGGHLRLAISGGASLDSKVIKFFDNLGIRVIEGYGLTETSPIISVNKVDDYRFGTVGKAIDCNQVIISRDKEILVKGDNVMLGYYKNEEFTKQAIDTNGYLHTGDLGFIDKDGFLTIIGRAKDMIVLSTGKKIFPEPLENVLNESRYISQSMVYGTKDRHISALIVPEFTQLKQWCVKNNIEYNLANQKIIDFYRSKVDERLNGFADIEKISNFQLLAEEFSQENGTLTPTLKLRRSVIFSKYIMK